jgi:hypothetical protein
VKQAKNECVSAADILKALDTVFIPKAHTIIAQVRNGVGYSLRAVDRTADALVFSTWPSRGLWLAGVEIKMYYSDWKRELLQPEKSAEIQKYCDYWYVATPAGMVPKGQLPATWGLIEVKSGKATIAVPAPKLESRPPDFVLICAIMRAFAANYVRSGDVFELAKKQADGLAKSKQYDLEYLERTVAEFEKESGVSLRGERSWNVGNIGKAVKVVLDAGLHYRMEAIAKLRTEAERIVKDCVQLEGALQTEEGR